MNRWIVIWGFGALALCTLCVAGYLAYRAPGPAALVAQPSAAVAADEADTTAAADDSDSATAAPPPPQSSETNETTEVTPVTSGIFAYKYKTSNLRIGIQINASGVALAVDNQTDETLGFDPKDIVITTSTGEYKPLTLHQVALMGFGAPGAPVSVAPHTSAGFILSGFCSRGPCADPSPNEAEILTQGTHVAGEIKEIRVGGIVLTRTGD